MILLNLIFLEDSAFAPLPKIFDPGWVGRYIAPIQARIIDGSRSKNGNLGLASGRIRPRIVGSCREKHLNIG